MTGSVAVRKPKPVGQSAGCLPAKSYGCVAYTMPLPVGRVPGTPLRSYAQFNPPMMTRLVNPALRTVLYISCMPAHVPSPFFQTAQLISCGSLYNSKKIVLLVLYRFAMMFHAVSERRSAMFCWLVAQAVVFGVFQCKSKMTFIPALLAAVNAASSR